MRDDGLTLLNWGCGSIQPDGWHNVDADHRWGVPTDTAMYADGTFDGAVANHSLQQVGHHDLPAVFAELARIVKPGGFLRVLVPDVVSGFRAFERHDRAWFPIDPVECPSVAVAFSRWLTWYGTNCTAFTEDYLFERAALGGWQGMRRADLPAAAFELDDRIGESLIVNFTRP